MGDSTERLLERSGDGRQCRKSTEEIRSGETFRNGHWIDQVMGDSAEQPLERSGEGRRVGTAIGEDRGGETAITATADIR